jgi:phosphatidylglycerol---prolipoprotein diacylglyceryl transferase
MTISLNISNPVFIHQIFEVLGIFVGFYWYRWQIKSSENIQLFSSSRFWILIGCLIGAGIGNKLVFWFTHANLWSHLIINPWIILQGQSMVGGLIGGWIGIEIVKKIIRHSQSTGDLMVVPIGIGLIIGRIGCFFAGLEDETYGVATQLPWGVDFGDGVSRHPTQIYEILFVLFFLLFIKNYKKRIKSIAGLQFNLFFMAYLLWRFLVDFIKPVPYAYEFGWSGIQWVCIVTSLIYFPILVKNYNKRFIHNA